MEDFKGMFASKTVWGGIVALLAGVLGILGYTIDATDQVTLVETATAIASAVGGVIAIYGRVKASKKIGKG